MPEAEAGPPPVKTTNRVRERDLGIVIAISGAAFTLLIAFGASLFYSGLIHFPDISAGEVRAGMEAYYNDALAYRERRLSLALILRTFLTGFSFIVGLALCTMGGVFILRQVTSLTTISGALAGDAPTPVQKGQLSFQAYSPGVIFLLGGVAVMAFTQLLAINVRAVEVTAPGGLLWCLDGETGTYQLCPEARDTLPAFMETAMPKEPPASPIPEPDFCTGPGGVNLCPPEEE